MYPSLTYIANLDMMTFTWHCVDLALCDRKVFFKFTVADQRKMKKKGRLNIEKRIFTDLEK